MKLLAHIRSLALIFALFIGSYARAQDFSAAVTVSTNLVVGTNTLTYGLIFTNQSGFTFNQVLITNRFSASVSLISITNSQGSNAIVGSSVVFFVGRMLNGQIEHVGLTIQPVFAGLLTNTLTLNAIGRPFSLVTNIVTTAVAQQADLGVSLIPPIQTMVTNDLVTYHLVVTNASDSGVSNIVVTHFVPTNIVTRAVNQSFSVVSNNYVFNIAGLGAHSSADLKFDITPTNVGSVYIAAAVQAAGIADINTNNDIVITNLPVIAYLPADLTAVTNSSQATNPQNGLTEQSVLLSNNGTNDVPAMRLVITGITGTNRLYNCVGTNNNYPFVYYSAPLAAGAHATLLLQFAPRSPTAYTNIQLHVYAVPLPDWTAHYSFTNVATNIITKLVFLPNGHPLIEFPATLGAAYTIIYASDGTFSDAKIAPPGIISPANKVQWIDYGPPTTPTLPASGPTNPVARFYRVLQSP